MATLSLQWDTWYGLILYCVCIPLYIFGFMKWHQWREDCLFRLRYSHATFIQVVYCLILVHMGVVGGVLSDLQLLSPKYFERVSDIFQWLLYFTIYYRANLVWVKWSQCQAILFKMGSADQKKEFTFSSTSAGRHWSSRVLLYMIIGGGITLFVTLPFSVHDLLSFFLWAVMWISGIVIFIKVKVKRVKEKIGCLYEIYILYFLWIASISFSVVTGDKYERVGNLMSYSNKHLFALFAIYFVLYLIKKTRGSLKEYNANERMLTESIESVKSGAETVPRSHALSSSSSIEQKEDDDDAVINIDPRKVKLFDFLHKRKHYDVFNKYLALCFCLENMLFVERICILRWIIIDKLMTKEEKMGIESRRYYSMKFTYLKDIYAQYDAIIAKFPINKFEDGRKALLEICLDLYNEYIDDGGMNQINIRHSVRRVLDKIFRYDPLRTHERSKSKRISQMVINTTQRASFMVGRSSKAQTDVTNPLQGVDVQRFESYQMFLTLFDDAFKDVWDLVISVYRMEFAQFLTQKS